MSATPRPLAPLGRRRVVVTATRNVGAYRVLHVVDPEGPEPWPGQFYMLSAVERWGAGEGERPHLPRAFSFLAAEAGTLSFMFEAVGPGTARIAELERGEVLWIVGPLGQGFEPPAGGGRALLAGGGIGVPPLAAWAARLDALGVGWDAVLGFRDAPRAPAAALLDAAGGTVTVATDDGSVGHHGPVIEPLAERLARGAAAGDRRAGSTRGPGVVVYACGPPAMLEAVRALCAREGVPAQLALEAGMACGYGACFGCVVPVAGGGYVRVCVDGPVLDAALLEAVPAHP